MSKNANLHDARSAKDDEFYTTWPDIEREMMAYTTHNPDVFRGKTILLPADDPESSNFTKFFQMVFGPLGIKKVISTSYNPGGQGKKFTLEEHGAPLKVELLDGDGDFRSDEVTALRDEADIIITNPPFSLFREFLAWASIKEFLLIGSTNAIAYKEVWPLIQSDKVWLGVHSVKKFLKPDGSVKNFGNICWFTNLIHGRRLQPLQLISESQNLKYNKTMAGKTSYDQYDNYDAISVPAVVCIPSDYPGIMGVPLSFLDKYCPDQFELVGVSQSWFQGLRTKTYPSQEEIGIRSKDDPKGRWKKGDLKHLTGVKKLNDGAAIKIDAVPDDPSKTYYKVNGDLYVKDYARIFIKHRETAAFIAARLAHLRKQIEGECISYMECVELQGYADHIDREDVLLLEWAGVPEFDDVDEALV